MTLGYTPDDLEVPLLPKQEEVQGDSHGERSKPTTLTVRNEAKWSRYAVRPDNQVRPTARD